MPGAKTILGIDLRVASVKLVEVEKGAVINSAMTEVPGELLHKHPQMEDAKAEALRRLIQVNKITSKEAYVVVGGGDTLIKLFTLSVLPPNEVAEGIKWKLSEEMPFPVEEALIDHYPLPSSGKGSEKIDYVAACISKKLYAETKYIVNKAGLKLLGVVVLPDALREVFAKDIEGDGSKIVSLIYMGKRTTNISVFRRGSFEYNRELTIGGDNITQAMTGVLVSPEGKVEISAEAAEKIKIEHGIPVDLEKYPKLENIPVGQLQAMVRPALEKIQSEISRTFEYYKGQTGESDINKIVFTGGASQPRNLKEFLSDSLGIPVITPEMPGQLDPRLSGALGAALVTNSKINLMPAEEKYPWKDIVNRILTPQILAPAILAFISLIYFIFWVRAFALQSELNQINRKVELVKPKIAQLMAMEEATQTIKKQEEILKTYESRRTLPPRIFADISRRIPESVAIEHLNVTGKDLRMTGTVIGRGDSAENILSRFVLALSVSPLLDDVKLLQASKNDAFAAEAFHYEITATVKE